MDPHSHHISLLSATATTTTTTTITTTEHGADTTLTPKYVPSNTTPNPSPIIYRLIFISFIGIISIWANQEASKGFSLTIINDAGKYSLPGKRFSLFYQSNDRITRIVLNKSKFVENLLYPNQDFIPTKKQINSVTLRLAPTNFPANVTVDSPKPHEYLINLSPSLMETSSKVVELAVLQGMARVWLWDGEGETPPVLLNGIVEYISSLAGFTNNPARNSGGEVKMSPENREICWKDEDPRMVAEFLRYCDQREQPAGGGRGSGGGGGAVVRRLNKGMRNVWHDWIMDKALGMPSQNACETYNMMVRGHHLSSSM